MVLYLAIIIYLIYTSITNGTRFSYYYLFNLHINTNGTLIATLIYLICTSITNGTLNSYYYLFNLHINK